jgi:hypothetical protein
MLSDVADLKGILPIKTPQTKLEKFNEDETSKITGITVSQGSNIYCQMGTTEQNTNAVRTRRRRRLLDAPPGKTWSVNPDDTSLTGTPVTVKLSEESNEGGRRRRRSLQSSTAKASVEMPNLKPVFYPSLTVSSSDYVCYLSVDEMPYDHTVTCEEYDVTMNAIVAKDHVLYCPGDSRRNYTYSCPEVLSSAYCNTFDPSTNKFKSMDTCTMTSYDDESTTCECSLTVSQDASSSSQPEVGSAPGIATSQFAFSFVEWPYTTPKKSEGFFDSAGNIAAVAAAVVVAVGILYYVDHRNKRHHIKTHRKNELHRIHAKHHAHVKKPKIAKEEAAATATEVVKEAAKEEDEATTKEETAGNAESSVEITLSGAADDFGGARV